jgi:regulator of PEP synthase PpsR (kinase-PPPase family)
MCVDFTPSGVGPVGGRVGNQNDGWGRGGILDELVKAKENIKRKYIELKTGEANVQQLFSQTFKPIIDPLTKLSDTTQSASNEKNNKESNFNENYQQEIENWFHSADFDKTYGPKKLSDGNIILG